MIPTSTISRYIQKKAVQDGIIAEITKNLIVHICKTQEEIECRFIQWILFVKNASQELRTTLFLQRSYIISKAEQKIAQSFHLYHTIKDIKFN